MANNKITGKTNETKSNAAATAAKTASAAATTAAKTTAATAKKEEPKKEAPKAAATTKTATKAATKSTEKKATKAAPKKPGRKPAKKAVEKVQEVFIQSTGNPDYKVEDIIERIHEQYKAGGHRVGAIKSLQVYVNLEEKKAYYVINGKAADEPVDLQ